jgi:hypothetical protein
MLISTNYLFSHSYLRQIRRIRYLVYQHSKENKRYYSLLSKIFVLENAGGLEN